MPGKSTVVYHWHGCMVHTYDKIHGYPTCYVLRAESKRVPMHSPWALRLAVTVLAAAAGGVANGGAVGLMQPRPATARRYGVSDAFDPEQNITAGAHYLRDLMARFGNDMELALAAYNAGEDAVERYGRSIPPFSETRHYV